ncbi:PREDICTED: probable tetraacyldisaccharide 4'-kinase, mitochondrial isoform X2 [Tarenaya hassleriana]|nr:PREDICTED: probable tetraacyldisaccharide 4'-kinase, mitochondrial isoform X2 [Tarenaya hassleriana]
MVEYIARCFVDSGISPLILTRGYFGGDEAKMLERHLLDLPVKIGIGANRAASASWFLQKYGYLNPWSVMKSFDQSPFHRERGDEIISEKIGAAILDDGMQHWSLCRDLEIVMLNGLNPWGNSGLVPLGPLREPFTALGRADIAVVHHADLITEQSLKDIELTIREFQNSIPIFYTKMTPKYLFDAKIATSHVRLEALNKANVLCVSAIGSAEAFVKSIKKIGADYIDRLDFSDHHVFQSEDIENIRRRLQHLEYKFNSKPIVVITEKDYDRDPEILNLLDSYKIFVLCSELQLLAYRGTTAEGFKSTMKRALAAKF